MGEFKVYCNLMEDDCHIYQKGSIKQIQDDRRNVISELLTSEENYVKELELIVNGYMVEVSNPNASTFEMPDGFRGAKAKIVFRSIKQIYEWHKYILLPAIKHSLTNVTKLSEIFIINRESLKVYVEFCRNKSISEQILHNYSTYFEGIRKNLKIDLTLLELLLKPVYRLVTYELFLSDILSHTKKIGKRCSTEANELEAALIIIKTLVQSCTYIMDFEKLKNFTTEISNQGDLLLSGTLACQTDISDGVPIENLRVFLFEKIIVFAYIVDSIDKFGPQYIYKTYIQTNKLKMKLLNHKREKHFVIYKINSMGMSSKIICKAETHELNNEWIDKINRLLPPKSKFATAVEYLKGFTFIDTKADYEFKELKNETASVFYD